MKSYFSYGVNNQSSNRDIVTSTINYEGVTKRYFSSIDAEIYIDDERVLDIVKIDYSYEEKKMPYYGFNSFIPSAVFVGQKLIQGTFVINFVKPGYIAELIHNGDGSNIDNEFDKVGISCDTNNSALFKKSFDIVIGYGGYKIEHENSYKSTYQTLQGVYINGYQQILDASGSPILEVYSFIARNLSFENISTIYGEGYTEYVAAKEEEEEEIVTEDTTTNTEEKEEETTTDTIEKNITVTHSKLTMNASKSVISVILPDSFTYEIESIKILIYSNFISLPNSYTLKNNGGKVWSITLNETDSSKLYKYWETTFTGLPCSLEINYKKDNKTATLTETTRMSKTW